MAQDSLKEHKEVAFNEFYTEVKLNAFIAQNLEVIFLILF